MAFLESERLILRRFVAADIDRLFALHNDPEVMRFLTAGEPISRVEIGRDDRERFMQDDYWAAVERASGTFVGWFALHRTPDRPYDEFELGYRLRKECWGKGYATEGSRALIGNAFAECGARRIWAQTMAVNLASRRVTELGDIEYALDRADWERRLPNLP